ncbi:MAG: AAA family ATPase [Syntrophus sp. (in: bacteria)]
MVDLNKKSTITDSELLAKDIPPVDYIVDGLLPATGLAVIGGKPKDGKTIMMTDLSLAMSGGGRFLGTFEVSQGEVLYLALEDTERRMKDRIKKMLPDCPPSGRIHFAFTWDDNGHGAFGNLSKWLDSHKNVKTVIIDTLSRFSPVSIRSQYGKQYEKFGELKKMADSHNILILVVHHLRKTKSADSFDMLYGGSGLAAAADTIWILQRARGEDFAKLIVSGRDIADTELCLMLDKTLLTWFIVDPITADLIGQELLRVFNILVMKGETMTLEDLSIATGLKKPVLVKYLKKLIDYGYVDKVSYGHYRAKHGRTKENRKSGSCHQIALRA